MKVPRRRNFFDEQAAAGQRMNETEEADAILVEELELSARVGVPEEERAQPQRLTISITLWPHASFREMQDQLGQTVNYSAVCREVKDLVSARADKLIETLAEAVAAHLLAMFPIKGVRIELRKFVLPDVKFVAVIITRERL